MKYQLQNTIWVIKPAVDNSTTLLFLLDLSIIHYRLSIYYLPDCRLYLTTNQNLSQFIWALVISWGKRENMLPKIRGNNFGYIHDNHRELWK